MSEPTRDARHIALAEIGNEGQARIAAGKVFIVGLGGLGCPAAEYLAASGVGTLVVNDFDHVDTTNLSRQILYGPEDVGRLKTEAAAERVPTPTANPQTVPAAEPEAPAQGYGPGSLKCVA